MIRILSKMMNRLSLSKKFLLILVLSMTIVCAVTLAAIRMPYSAYDEQLYQSSAQMITVFAERIQSELDDIDSISYRILADDVLQENLARMLDLPLSSSAWTSAKSLVSDRMTYFSIWMDNINTFQLKNQSGNSFVYTFGRSSIGNLLTPERINLARNMNGRSLWETESSGDGSHARLYLLREIREMHNLSLRPLATLLIEMDLQRLMNEQLEYMENMGSPLSCAIYSGDMCLFASDDQIAGIASGDDGYEHMQRGNEDVLCVRYTAPNGWKYVTLIDYGQIDATIGSAIHQMLLAIAIAIVLALALGALLMSGILIHLKVLLDKFDAFGENGRPMLKAGSPYLLRRDEIGQLHRHFDRMTRAHDKLIRENYEKQLILQEKQMQQLRAQVRPHFLFNTLESIYCLAKNAKEERIATMTSALGKMLRASLNDSRDVVPVSEDLAIAMEYIQIQLIRFGDRLNIINEVDADVMADLIPAMTIQPLVENAIHHAAEQMLDTCTIRIYSEKTPDGICIIVEDNGPGMDEDILEKLENGEIKAEGLGIGLRNIHRRIQYAFTDSYGLLIQKEISSTRVVIRLPKIQPSAAKEETDHVQAAAGR